MSSTTTALPLPTSIQSNDFDCKWPDPFCPYICSSEQEELSYEEYVEIWDELMAEE